MSATKRASLERQLAVLALKLGKLTTPNFHPAPGQIFTVSWYSITESGGPRGRPLAERALPIGSAIPAVHEVHITEGDMLNAEVR